MLLYVNEVFYDGLNINTLNKGGILTITGLVYCNSNKDKIKYR